MANNLLFTIICNDSTAASYSAGDQIDVLYNDSTEALNVNLNGSPVTSGGAIRQFEVDINYYSITSTGYQFCDGTDLNTFSFSEAFPYAFRESEFSEACSATVCDLEQSGTVSVTDATDNTTADGAITVSATSSNTPIEYKITGGNWQSSGTFSNLYPGTYSILARDNAGCSIGYYNITVGSTTIANNYGLYEYWYYMDKEDVQFKIELYQKDYSGSSTERTLLDAMPVRRSLRADNADRLVNILPSEFELNAMTETDREYLNLFEDSNEDDFLIKYYRDPGGANDLVGQWFCINELYSEEYEKSSGYVSNIRGIDNLLNLKDIPFSDEGGNQVSGDISILDTIRLCLRKTNLEQGFRVAVNLYETNHNQTAADDPLTQTFINSDTFYEDGDPLSSWDVLQNVLKSIFCDVMSYGGYWYIRYKPDMEGTYAYREFDKDGVYVSNSTINPIVDFKEVTESSRAVWLTGGKRLEGENIYNKINIISNRRLKESIIPMFSSRNLTGVNSNTFIGWSKVLNGDNGGILPSTFLSFATDEEEYAEGSRAFGFGILDDQGGDAYIIHQGTLEFKSVDTFTLKIPIYFSALAGIREILPYTKIKYSFAIDSKYLRSNGTFQSGVSIQEVIFSDYNQLAEIEITGDMPTGYTTNTSASYELRIYDSDPYQYDFEGTSRSNIESNLPTAVNQEYGDRYVTRIDDGVTYIYWVLGQDSIGAKEWDEVATVELPSIGNISPSMLFVGRIKLLTNPNGEPLDETDIITISTNKGNTKNLDYSLEYFDVNTEVNNAENLVSNYFKLSNGNPTSAWGTSGKKIQRIIAESISRYYSKMAYKIRGSFSTDLHIVPYNVFRESTDDNRLFMPVYLGIDDKRKKVDIEMIEVDNDNQAAPGAVSAFTSGFEQDAYR